MLRPGQVRAYSRGGELFIRPLKGKPRARATDLAATLLKRAEGCVGLTRTKLWRDWSELEVGLRERRLAAGLMKLVEDGCRFSQSAPVNPAELREELFLLASASRRQMGAGESFDRERLLSEVAARHQLSTQELESALYADLHRSHRLESIEPMSAETLIRKYEQASLQSVLLCASKLTATLYCDSSQAYRRLFNQLKFLRLLYRIEPLERGYRIDIDGPYSLFESVVKYGLALALALPALQSAAELDLVAELLWGKRRQPLRFRISSKNQTDSAGADSELGALPLEVSELLLSFEALGSHWHAAPTAALLHLPGVGLCVPDLMFEHRSLGARVYFEVLGYWSRQAVWRRVELVRAGLAERVLFAVNSRLRVSAEVLDGDAISALYVYKHKMNAPAVVRQLDLLIARAT
jgi:hypothetical protein